MENLPQKQLKWKESIQRFHDVRSKFSGHAEPRPLSENKRGQKDLLLTVGNKTFLF